MSMFLPRQLVDCLAIEILRGRDLSDAQPQSIDQIAQAYGVLFFPNPALRTEGRFIQSATGPVIEFRTGRPPARVEFTKAHEFAHWWMAAASSPLTRDTREAFTSIEELCDSLAAALLLPRPWLDQRVRRNASFPHNHTMEFLTQVADSTSVSREALVIRFRDVLEWPKILLTWERRGRWRYTGECGVRPWEFGRIRPSRYLAHDRLPEVASHPGVPQKEEPIELIIDRIPRKIHAEFVAKSGAAYALVRNPFLTSTNSRDVQGAVP